MRGCTFLSLVAHAQVGEKKDMKFSLAEEEETQEWLSSYLRTVLDC